MLERPHILFITDDQHRYDFLEMTGNYPVRTPHLARLAAEGVWHRHAYSTCPLCIPARASLHTGLYGHQHGLVTNMGDWPSQLPTLPRALQAHGYHTAAIGKLHAFEGVPEHLDLTTVRDDVMAFGYHELHEVSGKALAYYLDCEWTHHMRRKGLLDAYRAAQADGTPFAFDEADYQDVYITDHVVEWLEQYDDARPFFLWAGLVSPILPSMRPPAGYRRTPCRPRWTTCSRRLAGAARAVCRDGEPGGCTGGRVLEVLERRGCWMTRWCSSPATTARCSATMGWRASVIRTILPRAYRSLARLPGAHPRRHGERRAGRDHGSARHRAADRAGRREPAAIFARHPRPLAGAALAGEAGRSRVLLQRRRRPLLPALPDGAYGGVEVRLLPRRRE